MLLAIVIRLLYLSSLRLGISRLHYLSGCYILSKAYRTMYFSTNGNRRRQKNRRRPITIASNDNKSWNSNYGIIDRPHIFTGSASIVWYPSQYRHTTPACIYEPHSLAAHTKIGEERATQGRQYYRALFMHKWPFTISIIRMCGSPMARKH